MSLEENGAAEAVTENTAAPTEQVTEAQVETTDAWDADLQAVWDKAHQPRAEDGTFAGTTEEPAEEAGATEEPATETEGQTQTEEGGQETPATAAPQSWPAEMKAKWAEISPEVRDLITKRETEAHSRISDLGQAAAEYQPLKQVLEHHKDAFVMRGQTYEQGVEKLLAADAFLSREPVRAIKWLADSYGVNLAQFGGQQTNEGQQQVDPQIASLQAHIATLTRQLNETNNRVTHRETQEQESHVRALESRIDAFASSKPDWASLERHILANVQVIAADNPGMDHQKILEQAYEDARWSNRETRAIAMAEAQKAEAEKKAKEEAERVVKAKKASAANVRGDVVSGENPKSIDDELGEIAAKHYGRKG